MSSCPWCARSCWWMPRASALGCWHQLNSASGQASREREVPGRLAQAPEGARQFNFWVQELCAGAMLARRGHIGAIGERCRGSRGISMFVYGI